MEKRATVGEGGVFNLSAKTGFCSVLWSRRERVVGEIVFRILKESVEMVGIVPKTESSGELPTRQFRLAGGEGTRGSLQMQRQGSSRS